MVVKVREKVAYDEQFHQGLNIIRGKGSSGKSTILELLFFGLGGESIEWQPEALQCDVVYVEARLNEATVTLRRDISSEALRPMWICWAGLDQAMAAPLDAWQVFPFSQQGSLHSFSQVLFDALDLPAVKGDFGSRITMNGILRLMYVDQESAANAIFRQEQFDPALKREAIGELLCGFYDNALYDLEMKLRELQGERDAISRQITTTYQVFHQTEQQLSAGQIRTVIEQRRATLLSLRSRIDDLRASAVDQQELRREQKTQVKSLRTTIYEARQRARDLNDEIARLSYETTDSAQFISAIEQKLGSVSESHTTREALGELRFQFCPSCFADVAAPASEHICALCQQPLQAGDGASRLIAIRTDLVRQLEESRRLQENRVQRLTELKAADLANREVLTKAETKYQRWVREMPSTMDAALAEAIHQHGYVEREVEALLDHLRIAEVLETLQEKLADAEREMSVIGSRVAVLRRQKEDREKEIRERIAHWTKLILEADLDREEAFKAVMTVDYDFHSDHVTVNGRRKFSASSMVLLRNAFHFAILMTSLEKPYVRYPRFLMADDIEGGGMEAERSQNFQRLVARLSAEADVEHQIIMTTSAIDPSLNTPPYTVGESYGPGNKSLKHVISVDAREEPSASVQKPPG